MDRHDLPGVTAEDVAAAHQEDLKIQNQFDCRALTYWFDGQRQTAFCLIEAPDENAVKNMHDHAHGLVPHTILEVDPTVVNAFLGRIEDPQPQVEGESLVVPTIDEPAYRVIMCLLLRDLTLSPPKEADATSRRIRSLIERILKKANSRIVDQSDLGYTASFTSATDAIFGAREIVAAWERYLAEGIDMRIGISAGSPFRQRGDLFGEAVQLARRMCTVAHCGEILITTEVRDLCAADQSGIIRGESRIGTLSPQDEDFLQLLMDNLETLWNEVSLNVAMFSRSMGMSRSQMYRKTMALTGFSPNDLVREYRLIQAVDYIKQQRGNLAEIAFEVGFGSPSYFARCFHRRFGFAPSSYSNLVA